MNELLAPYGRKFAPDPASVKSAMVGGIVMNNASGMNCGTHANSDKVLVSARIILMDGTLLDTGNPVSRASFEVSHRDSFAASANCAMKYVPTKNWPNASVTNIPSKM